MKTNIILALIAALAIYAAYHYQDKLSTEEKQSKELTGKVEYLEQQAIKTNQLIAQNEANKQQLENESIKQQEQINELLKNNKCANDIVPATIFDKLYKRADKIRQPASTDKPN